MPASASSVFLSDTSSPTHAETYTIDLTGGQTKVARCGAFFVVCGDTRRVPAASLGTALRGYSREVSAAIADAGADPASAFVLA